MTYSKSIKLYMRSSIWNLDGDGNREGAAEVSESEYDATLSIRPRGTVARYTEKTEGGKILCEITFSEDCVTVKKSGAIESLMVFKSGEEFKSLYSVPPFSFDMKILTKALKCSVSDAGGEATVLYRMEIGGASKSCSMKITLGIGGGSGE